MPPTKIITKWLIKQNIEEKKVTFGVESFLQIWKPFKWMLQVMLIVQKIRLTKLLFFNMNSFELEYILVSKTPLTTEEFTGIENYRGGGGIKI